MESGCVISLELTWTEPPKDPRLQWDRYFGELLDSTARLQRVAEEIDEAVAESDIQHAVSQLLLRMETYFHSIYDLRERAISILECITGKKDLCAALKKPDIRTNAAASLVPFAQEAVQRLLPLLELLDDDIDLRNKHTHKGFASFVLRIDDDPHDVESMLLEIYRKTPSSAAVEGVLRREMRSFGDRYCARIEAISKSSADLIPAIDPWTMRSKQLA